MEKRVFLAIFLCFAVAAIWQSYFVTKPPPSPPVTTTAPAGGVAPGAIVGAPGNPAASAPAAAGAETPPPAAAPLLADASARDIVVETDSARAVISTAGAALTSWKLKK